MNAVPFDTLKLARGLEAAGLAAPVAAGTASALADAMGGADLATKADLAMLESRVMGAVGALEAKTDARFDAVEAKADTRADSLEAKIDTRIDSFEARVDARFAASDAKLELLRRDMTIKPGGMMFIATGVILAAMRLMPHP